MRNRMILPGFALLLIGTFGIPTLHGQSVPAEDKSAKQMPGAPNAEALKGPNNPVAGKQADGRVRLQARLVSLTVTVTDAGGRVITSLGKDNFEVYDDGVRQEIAQFGNDDAPISIGFIYDVSGSMKGLTPSSFIALRRFFDVSHKDDEYFIIAFNEKPYLLQDFTASTTAITTPVMFANAKGSTAYRCGLSRSREGARGTASAEGATGNLGWPGEPQPV